MKFDARVDKGVIGNGIEIERKGTFQFAGIYEWLLYGIEFVHEQTVLLPDLSAAKSIKSPI